MNILILISSLEIGGAEKQAVIDANLLSLKHRVFLGYFRNGKLKDQLDLSVTLVYFKKTNYLVTAFRLFRFIKKQKIDIIHASLFASMVISALASFLARVPVIWHFHSHEFDIPFRSRIAFKRLAKINHVKKILFVNKELLNYFHKRFQFPDEKLGILYNSSSLNLEKINSKNLNKKIVNIGYVGRLVELKRVNFLIEAARYLCNKGISNFRIHIVGDGDQKNALESLAKDLNVEKKILFWGHQQNLENFYRDFDIFVLPSREECLSIALIDAAMMGLPTIAFDVGGNNEIIVDSVSGFIVKNKNELFEKLELLIIDTNLRLEMGREAQKWARKNFSQEAHIDGLDEVYKLLNL